MYEGEKKKKKWFIILWTNLLLQVLPLRNHHIIILALFPKFHGFMYTDDWFFGWGVGVGG